MKEKKQPRKASGKTVQKGRTKKFSFIRRDENIEMIITWKVYSSDKS